MSEVIEGRYVVGMDWFSIVVGGDKQKAALARAKKSGANWIYHRGKETWAGIAKLPRSQKPLRGSHFVSLGRVAGSRNPYRAAFLALTIPGQDQRVWICGTVDGIPINQFEGIVDPSEVQARFQRFAALRDFDPNDCRIESDVADIASLAPINLTWEEFVEDIPEGGEFAALRSSRPSVFDSMSPRLRMALGASLASVMAFYAWGEYQKVEQQRLLIANQVPPKDPAIEWKKAIDTWSSTKISIESNSFQSLLQSLQGAPVEINGWDLSRVECKLQMFSWGCIATYDRTRLKANDPTNGSFIRAIPQAWKAVPKTLDLIEAHFKVEASHGGQDLLRVDDLKTIDWHLINTTDLLQKASRAFANISLSAFTPTQISPPRRDDGLAMEVPVGVPRIAQASVILSGPMRSLDLDEVRALPVVWNALTLTFSQQAMQRASLVQSALMVEAKGDLYAKQ